MPSLKGRILSSLGALVLTDGTVASVSDLGPRFRLLRVASSAAAAWQPGDKAQLVLPSRDVRTYTPLYWNPDPDDTTAFLVYRHGDSPAGRWISAAAAGAPLRFKGPDRSLSMPDGPITLIGDETSIAVMVAYQRARATLVRALLASDADLQPVLRALKLEARCFSAGQHRAIAEAALQAGHPIGITGSGALIKAVRAVLRERDVRPKVKAYWVQGRTGLD